MDRSNATYLQIKTAFEELPSMLKSIGTVGSICGFAYLFAYTRDVGIPFPLELSVLPTTLLLVGMMSLFGTLIIASGILVPAALAHDPLDVTNSYLLAKDVNENKARIRIRRYIVCNWIPMVVSLFGAMSSVNIFSFGYWNTFVALICCAFSVCWILGTSKCVEAFKGKRLEFVITMVAQSFLSVFAYFLLITVLLIFYPEIGDADAWKVCGISLVFFSLIHLFITMPHDASMGKKIVLPPHFEIKTTTAPIVACIIAAAFVLISVVNYPINAKIGRTTIQAFGAGGGTRVVICLKDAPSLQLTQKINFNGDKCSESLVNLFDAGDRMYVAKPLQNQKNAVHSGESALEPIYFRQDQILTKIYEAPSARKVNSQAPKANGQSQK